MPEGAPRRIERGPVLADATDFAALRFVPQILGGELAEFDEYRCFELDSPVSTTEFVTGYEVPVVRRSCTT